MALTPATAHRAPATQNAREGFSANAQAFINELFRDLSAIFPAWKHAFETEADLTNAKRVWLETIANEKLKRSEIARGLNSAKKSGSPFLPSIGEFVKWCKQVDYEALGLADAATLRQRLALFQSYGMSNLHEFKFRSNAEYWLITDLYIRCRQGEWREEKLQAEIEKALAKMVETITAGRQIPEPKITLPAKVERRLSQEEITARWTKLRMQMRGKV